MKITRWIMMDFDWHLKLLPKWSDFGVCKAAVVAGVGEGLMLVNSATEYNYPPPSPRAVFILLLSPQSHWSDCTGRALSDVILPCTSVEYPKHYLRLQAVRVQQQQEEEYYRMVGILTASWRRWEQQQSIGFLSFEQTSLSSLLLSVQNSHFSFLWSW